MKKMRRFNRGGMEDFPESGSLDMTREAADEAAVQRAMQQFEGEPYKTPSPAPRRRAAAPRVSAADTSMARETARARMVPTPPPAPAPARAAASEPAADVTSRMKASLARMRAGSGDTDMRSVTERMGGSERGGSSTSTDTRSFSDRLKDTRERARSSSTGTDTRSVGERLRASLGFAKGGSVSSASKRADGIAQRGKTKGRVL